MKEESPYCSLCGKEKGVFCECEEHSHILPCPCCGSSDIRSNKVLFGVKISTGLINCRECGLRMETSCGQKEAELRWNNRI